MQDEKIQWFLVAQQLSERCFIALLFQITDTLNQNDSKRED